MSSVTKYAKTISQTTGGKFRSFNNLGNLKNNTDNSWAVSSGNIKGKSSSPNRPSTISLTNFGFSLPVGAEVTKVIVEYRHKKSKVSGAKNVCNIPSPTITLLGVSGFSGKGVAPSTAMTTNTKTFKTDKITRTQINSSSFGVKIDYPTNTNNYEGTLSLSYIRIKVEYKTTSYGLSIKKVSGGYNGDDYVVEVAISNKNLTNFSPALTLTAPQGFSFKSGEFASNGHIYSLAAANARTVSWNPGLNRNTGTLTAFLRFSTNVTFPTGVNSYTGSFVVSESLLGTTGSHSATITKKPANLSNETIGDEKTYDYGLVDDEGTPDYTVKVRSCSNGIGPGKDGSIGMRTVNESNNEDGTTKMTILADKNIKVRVPDSGDYDIVANETLVISKNVPYYDPNEIYESFEDPINQLYFYSDAPCIANIQFLVEFQSNGSDDWETLAEREWNVEFVFTEEAISSFDTPFLAMMNLSEEEINRLGDKFSYIVQSFMKRSTEDTYHPDWFRNCRIGVFNNAILENVTTTTETVDGETVETVTDSTDYENLTIDEIFENAEYWSDGKAGLNTQENVECEFVYNKNYPVYILITGDYMELDDYGYDMGTIKFTEPCIIESDVYQEREPNGNYPVSIIEVITDGTAELNVESFEMSSPVILYDFPLDEGFGTTEELGIRGIIVSGTIEQSDELTINAKLKSPDGIIGQRSIVVNESDTTIDSTNEFMIGGLGDLWGFNTLELVNLEEWEVELTVDNNLRDDASNINFGNVQVAFYVETIEKQRINIKVEGEDLSFYGAFTQDVKIQEGLETDTDFLNIRGTDTNDATNQDIREKEIEIELSVYDCDLQTSTDMLRQLTKLLLNERDRYNTPIPKIIEFSHCPDIYFKYLILKPFDTENENGEYNVKAKLTIPDGTAYSKKATITGGDGFVQGVASITPVITFKPQSDTIEIVETVSGQRFNMTYNDNWQNKIVELDCGGQTALLKTNEDDSSPTDISNACDFNVDWFVLHGEYHFEITGGVIRTVTFNERW